MEGCEEIVMSDPSGGVYKKLVLQGRKLVGACLYGDTTDGSWYFKLIQSGQDVSAWRQRLIFGEALVSQLATPEVASVAPPAPEVLAA